MIRLDTVLCIFFIYFADYYGVTVLVGLYEEQDKPSSALEYVHLFPLPRSLCTPLAGG
jgi:hypothetical protein